MGRAFRSVGGVGLSLALLLNSVGCGGGGHHGGGTPSPGGAFRIASVSGRVAMPGGISVPSGTSVSTALGAFPVKGDGSFTARVVDALPSLVTVSAGGTPLMMGMFGKDRTTIDATSEALALCLFRTGMGALPYHTLKVVVLQGGETPAVRDLAQALSDRGSANPTFAGLYRACATDIVAASAAFVQGGSRGVQVVDADPKSGVTVIQESLQRIVLQNAYRRRAFAFVDRMGYVPHDSPAGTPETPSEKEIASVMLEPTVGVTSITGGFLDAIAGKVAYTPTTSEPTELPNVPADADYTRYKVTVLGLGSSLGDQEGLSTARKQRLNELEIETLFLDLLVPMLSNLALGGLGVSQLGTGIDLKDEYVTYAGILRSAIGLAQNGIPDLADDLEQGKVGAAMGKLIDFAVADNTFQNALTLGVTKILSLGLKGLDAQLFSASMTNIFGTLAVGDLVLSAADFGAILHDVLASEEVSTFEVRTTASRVKLSPPRAETNAYTEVALEAKAFDVDENEPGVAYDWSVSGVGALRDGTQNATTIRERDGKLSFAPNAGQFGTATVTVKVTKTNADGTTQSLGEATAKIEVKDVQVLLTPRRQSIRPNASATFSAKVTNDVAGGPYLYRFRNSNAVGAIDDESKLQSSPSVTYRAKSAEGRDTVTVEVYRSVQGTPLKIAETTGEARVEQEPTIIQGTLQFLRESYADGTTPYRCISAYVGFSPPPGATRLVLHGYGGNDTAYYGTSIERTLYPPFSTTSFIGTPIPNATGLAGGGGAGTADPDDSWYRARFGGFTWEIEVYK